MASRWGRSIPRSGGPSVHRVRCWGLLWMDAVGLGSTRRGTVVQLASRFFPQHLPVASFILGVTLSVCWTEGGISWLVWAQPLVPLPAGLPTPAVELQPPAREVGTGAVAKSGSSRVIPSLQPQVPAVGAQQLLGTISGGKLMHFVM